MERVFQRAKCEILRNPQRIDKGKCKISWRDYLGARSAPKKKIDGARSAPKKIFDNFSAREARRRKISAGRGGSVQSADPPSLIRGRASEDRPKLGGWVTPPHLSERGEGCRRGGAGGAGGGGTDGAGGGGAVVAAPWREYLSAQNVRFCEIPKE